jgi:hypothetical protein
MSKSVLACSALALAAAALAGSPASAHHSYAMFDDQVTMTLPATVQQWQWTNPHSFLEVVDANGMHWSLETASPSMLSRNGISRNSFKPGDKVTVRMHPRRDKQPIGSLLSAQLTDGHTLMFEAARPAGGPGGPGGPPGGAPPQ